MSHFYANKIYIFKENIHVDFIQYVHSTRLLEAVLFMYQIS